MNGGYQIVSLKNINFESGDGFKIDGIFNTIKNTTKPILLTGIVLGGTKFHDTFVQVGLYEEDMFPDFAPNYGNGYFIMLMGLSPRKIVGYYFISEDDYVYYTDAYYVE